MSFTARHRRIGRWSALLAVYAFVLNALLATTLLAATSASKSLSGFELCSTAAAGAAASADHSDHAVKRAAIHCQLCLQHAASPALLPPVQAGLPVRTASPVRLDPSHGAFVRGHETPPAHRPRGPPALI